MSRPRGRRAGLCRRWALLAGILFVAGLVFSEYRGLGPALQAGKQRLKQAAGGLRAAGAGAAGRLRGQPAAVSPAGAAESPLPPPPPLASPPPPVPVAVAVGIAAAGQPGAVSSSSATSPALVVIEIDLGEPGGTPKAARIRIRLRDDLSPQTTAFVRKAAAPNPQGGPAAGRLYRAEPVPPPGAIDNFGGPGPPYALVQGSLPTVAGFQPLTKEGSPLVERGDVCMIGSGPDFFIAIGPHHEWGNGHTVWGQVVDGTMAVADAVLQKPLKNETWGQTHVSVLVTPLPFTLAAVEA